MLQSRAVKIIGGTVVYVVGAGFAYEMSRPVPKLPSCGERCCTFNQLAPKYDQEIEKDEATSGIADLRKAMAAQASGNVLEVAGGTGRNLRYYGSNVTSLLITDYSEAMLQVAARKVAELRAAAAVAEKVADKAAKTASANGDSSSASSDAAGGGSASSGSASSGSASSGAASSGAASSGAASGGAGAGALSSVTLAVTDAAQLALPDASYDTVVDTFGLCSFEDPEAALREIRRCCKPGGRILLLEHGESDWSLLAKWQRHRLNRHVVKWGCYWNRDILGLVKESGLRIKEIQRKHMGTTYLIVCENPQPT